MKLITALLITVSLALPIQVQARPTVGLELMWGLGKSSSKDKGINSKFCKNRTWGGMKGLGLYLSNDNVEVHLSRYSHDTDAENCERSNWVLGAGPVLSSRNEIKYKDLWGEWTPGIIFRLNETWRDQSNWGFYNRFRAGTSVNRGVNHQTSLEVSFLQYGGFFESNHGESFLTLGISNHELGGLNGDNNFSNSDDSGSNNNDSTDQNSNDGSNGNNGSSGDDNNPSTSSPGDTINQTTIINNIDNSVDIFIEVESTPDTKDDTDEESEDDLDKGHGNNKGGNDKDNPGKGKNK